MNLDPARRLALANGVTRVLAEAVRGSSSGLRGSLVTGSNDRYSDIDAWWLLPDAWFEDGIDALAEILAPLRPIDSIRSDPLLQHSDKRRLVFVQFAGVPLYWRVDLEVFAESIGMDSSYDLDNRDARGDDWSLTHSALTNGVAALKYLLRDDGLRAAESLGRAFDRIDLPVPDEDPWDQVATLAEAVGRRDLELAPLVRQVQLLHRDALAERSRRHPEPAWSQRREASCRD